MSKKEEKKINTGMSRAMGFFVFQEKNNIAELGQNHSQVFIN